MLRGLGLYSLRKNSVGGIVPIFINTLLEGMKTREQNCSQEFPMTRQGVMDTATNTSNSI